MWTWAHDVAPNPRGSNSRLPERALLSLIAGCGVLLLQQAFALLCVALFLLADRAAAIAIGLFLACGRGIDPGADGFTVPGHDIPPGSGDAPGPRHRPRQHKKKNATT